MKFIAYAVTSPWFGGSRPRGWAVLSLPCSLRCYPLVGQSGACAWPDVIARRSGRFCILRQRAGVDDVPRVKVPHQRCTLSKSQTCTTHLRRRVIRGCLGIWPPHAALWLEDSMGSTPMGGLHAPSKAYAATLPHPRSWAYLVCLLPGGEGRAGGVRVRVAATASRTEWWLLNSWPVSSG